MYYYYIGTKKITQYAIKYLSPPRDEASRGLCCNNNFYFVPL